MKTQAACQSQRVAIAMVCFLFVGVQAAFSAPANGACELPKNLQAEIAGKYPGARIVTQADLSGDDLKFYRHDHGNACPGLASADFYGDGKPTLAVVLWVKKDIQFIIAREIAREWTIRTLDTAGDPVPVVWSQAPGKYTDIERGKILRAAHPVFVFCGYESFAVVYAWTGKRIDKVWIMD